ncbi:ATPase [Veronia nyctiphanis]|uniref:ATPase n=1 Tax=Veronia nyctiphanis TaxID=1278244 RepID=A0A4Q0YPI2_9GAMM|nr:ATPase [Veronia nyctiphanis]
MVSDNIDGGMSWKQTKALLGQDCFHVALDISEGLDAERLCAIAGCIRGGSLLILFGLSESPTDNFFLRLCNMFNQKTVAVFCQQEGVRLPALADLCVGESVKERQDGQPTNDQEIAIQSVKKVLGGHRRRPCLLTADRGRGKSSAMGMAAASILCEKKTSIVVTSPRKANVETLFSHARNLLELSLDKPYELVTSSGGRLRYVAPDQLIRDVSDADFVLVDEAAAIPLPMLERLLSKFSRICFSTTEHGYEGTGKGFTTRFRALLDARCKGWKEVTLHQPIRWAESDPLELWLSDTFLFDCEPALVAFDEASPIDYRIVEPRQLLGDEAQLRSLFGLLISAHYQTSPNDLKHILNDASCTILTANQNDVVVGALLAQKEGEISDVIADKIVAGERRVRGHLLAQGLGFYTGDSTFLSLPCLRVSRVAVLPSFRRHGVASQLVKLCEQTGAKKNVPLIGTSFGATSELFSFWRGLGFLPIKMGTQRDSASGHYSLLMTRGLDDSVNHLPLYHDLFEINFSKQLAEQFFDLEPRSLLLSSLRLLHVFH